MAELIANDKYIWSLLFADTHGANIVSVCARHLNNLYSKRQIIFDVYYNFNLDEWEQGSIGSSGNLSSNTRIRTPGYLSLIASYSASYTITAHDTAGNPLQYNIMMYDGNGNNVLDSPWYDSGYTLENDQHGAVSIRICLRYSDQRAITPEILGSCNLIYVYSTEKSSGSLLILTTVIRITPFYQNQSRSNLNRHIRKRCSGSLTQKTTVIHIIRFCQNRLNSASLRLIPRRCSGYLPILMTDIRICLYSNVPAVHSRTLWIWLAPIYRRAAKK